MPQMVHATEAWDDLVKQRMGELRAVFDPPYDRLSGLTLEGHEPGECIQCDAYRRLAEEDG